MDTSVQEDHEDHQFQTDISDEVEDGASGAAAAAATQFSRNDVRWNPHDDEQPDYRHLHGFQAPSEFELKADDLEALIDFNDFRPLSGRLIFALRGAALVGTSPAEGVQSISLRDRRPDHLGYRCIIGVMDRDSRQLWAYPGSTVPNAGAVFLCYSRHQAGLGPIGNILPTGCYTYTVGTHRAGQDLEILGALRLSNTPSGASKVLVLRSLTDVVYDTRDSWDPTTPADNIHPGRHDDRFSSEGCLTLPGNYDRGTRRHSGLWGSFRSALGLSLNGTNGDDGRQFSCLLLTAADVGIAARLRASGEIGSPAVAEPALRRLRHGSRGERVRRLQEALGLDADPQQLVGPVTRDKLARLQRATIGWADGIYSPEMDALLGLGVFDTETV